MSVKIEDLEAAALELPETGRARLARILLLSLGDPVGESTDQAWIEETEYRYEEIRRGEVEAQDSDEVFREARARRR